MIKKLLSIVAIGVFIIAASIFFTASGISKGSYAHSSTSGSPGGKSGSPGDVTSCLQCHSGSLNPGNATRSITAPSLASGYVPGQTYTITASISNTASSKIGFEVTPEIDATNAKTGGLTITDASRTKLVNLSDAVTHTATGTSATGGANSWSFDWTAPAQGTGSVTFYGAFNVTNGGNNSGGDQIYSASLTVQEAASTSIAEDVNQNGLSIYPNPSSNGVFSLSTNSAFDAVVIYNSQGQEIDASIQNNTIDISKHPRGIYFMHLIKDGQHQINKIIKQ